MVVRRKHVRAAQTALASLTLATLVTGCFGGEIPIVGYDAEGKAIETLLSKQKYVNQMSGSVRDMSESVIPVADDDRYGDRLSGLRGIRLGLGLKGSVGIGDYWKLGGNIGFGLHFTNK
jgi:hypothetical protein